MNSVKQLLPGVILCIIALNVSAQTGDTLELQKNEKGKIRFARFKATEKRKLENGNVFLTTFLQAKEGNEFRQKSQATDAFGNTHYRYQQYYKGVKIEGAEFLTHGKKGLIETVNGNFSDISIASVTPALTESQALLKATGFVNAKKYKWEDAASESFIKQNRNDPSATYYPRGELVISEDYLKGTHSYKLSWKFTISSLLPGKDQLVFIDAGNGDVINSLSLDENVNTPCTAQTLYSGQVGITGDSYTGGFRLREVRNAVNVATLNLQGGFTTSIDFTNNNTNWLPGNWPAYNQDRQALDAHWGAERVLDFWLNVFGRNSINGAGLPVTSYVHYYNPNTAQTEGWPNNAQWNSVDLIMRYGDGDGGVFRPLTALDVCGHEFAHGVCQFTANIAAGTSGYDDANALNEGLSDIWGASIEHWAAPAKQTWLMGEELFFNGVFSCIRNLQNPKTTTAAEGQHPDTYHGQFWTTNANAYSHTNSTVLSHWFYLVSQGGSGTNDNGNSFSINGIGMDNAERIVYQAETQHLHAGATYTDARNAMISAVRDINHGVVGSCQEICVTNAWYAVGVGGQYASPTTPAIAGPDAICYNNTATYSLTNVIPGQSITWGPSDAYKTVTPSVDGLSATVKNISTASVAINISATVAGCYGPSYKAVALGAPTIYGSYTNTFDNSSNPLGYYPGINNPACTGYYINTNMQIVGATAGVPNVTWTKVSSTNVVNFNQTANDIRFYLFGANQNVVFKLTAQNGCGTTTNQFAWLSSNCGTGGGGGGCGAFTISPNPSTGRHIFVNAPGVTAPCNLTGFTTPPNNNLLITGVRIYDNTGTLKKDIKEAGTKQRQIDISGLLPGTYMIEIRGNNNYRESHVFIKQ